MSSAARKSFWLMAGLVAALVVLVAGHDLYWQRKVAVYRAELKARGESLSIDEVIDHFPLAAYSAGKIFQGMVGKSPDDLILPGGMRLVAPGRAVVVHRLANIWTSGNKTGRAWEELGAQVEAMRPSLVALGKALEPEQIANRIDYSLGFNALLPQLADMKGLSLRFSCATVADLNRGDFPGALANLLAGLHLPKAIAEDHFMISELVRIAISAITFPAVWETMQSPECDDSALARIAAACKSAGYFAAIIRSLELERAINLDAFKTMRRSHSARMEMITRLTGDGLPAPPPPAANFGGFSQGKTSVLNYLRDFSGRIGLGARSLAWRWLWSGEDEYYFLRMIQAMIDSGRDGLKQHSLKSCQGRDGQIARDLQRLTGNKLRDRFLFTRNILPAWRDAFGKAAGIEVQKQLVLAAIAIRRHEFRHGRLPEALDGLVPEFLSEVPRDWMDGMSLRYRPGTNGQFLLYSVGRDFKDGGGDGSMMDENKSARSILLGKDIVWPVPATPEEIAEATKASKSRR
ncbi:MAG TPA: hypothetical protein VHH73_11675 [Verrucomicrobiae bacterium]|nr:hypothetical protein [Verrucomicrobiae bacterium]